MIDEWTIIFNTDSGAYIMRHEDGIALAGPINEATFAPEGYVAFVITLWSPDDKTIMALAAPELVLDERRRLVYVPERLLPMLRLAATPLSCVI